MQVTQFYGKEKLYTSLLRHVDFYIMPVINVDGYDYTWKTVGEGKRSKIELLGAYREAAWIIHGILHLGDKVLLWKI